MDIIRIGNDINVTWSVFGRNGAKYSLTGKIYHLWLVSGPRKKEITSYSLQARNQIVFVIDDGEINRLGTYKIILQLKEPDNDTQDATYELTHVFQIVSETYPMKANKVINGQSDIAVKSILKNVYISDLEGASAYEIAVNNGFVGTEAEWVGGFVGRVRCEWPWLIITRADNSEFRVDLTHTHPSYEAAISALQGVVNNIFLSSNDGSYYTLTIGGTSVNFYSKAQVDALVANSGGGSGSGGGGGSDIPEDTEDAYLNFYDSTAPDGTVGTVTVAADGTVNTDIMVKANIPWAITETSMPDETADEETPQESTAINVYPDIIILAVAGTTQIEII